LAWRELARTEKKIKDKMSSLPLLIWMGPEG